MATKSRLHVIKSPHDGEQFNLEIKNGEVNLFWKRKDTVTVSGKLEIRAIFADAPKSEVILLLKEMIEKLEGGES